MSWGTRVEVGIPRSKLPWGIFFGVQKTTFFFWGKNYNISQGCNEEKKTQQPQFLGKSWEGLEIFFCFLGGVWYVWAQCCDVCWWDLLQIVFRCFFNLTPERNNTKTPPFCVCVFPLQEGIFERLPQVKGMSNLIQTENIVVFGLETLRFRAMFDQMIKNLQHSNKAQWREIFPRSLWCIFDWDEVDVGTRNGNKTMEGNTCSMAFRVPDIVGSNVPGIGKGLRHQEGPTSEKPNAETSWDMLMKEIPNNHLLSMKPYEKVRYSPYQLVIAGFLPSSILGSRFLLAATFCMRWSSKRRNCKRIRQSLKRRTSCVMDVIRSFRPFGICWSGTPGSDGHK